MREVFLTVLKMSISASWLVLAVLLLRLVLKKAPKWVSVLLWGFVALRLLMPFSIESNYSLIPDPLADGQIISNVGDVYLGETDTIEIYEGHEQQTGQQPIGSFVAEEDSIKPPKTVGNTVYPVLSWIWLAGIAAMLMYTAVSYLLLRRKVATAVLLRNNICQSENVDSPFVLGIIKPKIYLPFRMDDQTLEYVIAHEESHIRRKDHWWKPFGFVLLAIHWFNPLMWIGYILLCRDIELACDEKVIKEMDNENRANYTEALVACSITRRSIAACPLAFGEVGVKERVKSVMNYKKPAFWIIIAAVVICIAVAVCFLTNPNTGIDDPLSVFIDCQIAGHFQTEESERNACCVNWEVLGTRKRGSVTTVYMWVLYQEYSMNFEELHDKEFVLNPDDLYEETGTHIPTVITVRQEDGQYKLIEYWEPKDGSYLVPGIREKFPWYLQHKALDSQRYIKKQQDENEKMAMDYFQSQLNNGGAERPEYAVITNHAGILSVGIVSETYLLGDLNIIDNQTGNIIYGGDPTGSSYLDRMSIIINEQGEIINSDDQEISLSPNDMVIIDNNRGEILYSKDRKITFSLDNVIIINNKTGQIVYGGKNGIRVTDTISTELKTYYKLSDGTWLADGYKYQYRLEISGRMPNAAVDSTFVYLSNLKTISFARAWRAAGLSSNLEDYFSPEEAVLVEWYHDKDLTLDDVIALSQKGDDLSWSDFGKYNGSISGSGVVVRIYKIDGMFEVRIGGDSTEAKPSYINLVLADDLDKKIDIRDGGVEEFIAKYSKVSNENESAVEGVNDYVIKTDRLNGAIAEVILSHHKREKPDGLLNTESHIILVNEAVSGTPLVGQTGHVREVTVYVYYLNMRYHVQGDRPEEHDGIYGTAIITFTIDDNGIYHVKHFIKPESSFDSGADYSAELKYKFVAASEDIAENEEKYDKQLLDGCWRNATEYMEHIKNQASAQPGGTR